MNSKQIFSTGLSLLLPWTSIYQLGWSLNNFPAGIRLFKVYNRITKTACKICSKLTIKIPERRFWHHSGVLIVTDQTSHIVLMFPLLTWQVNNNLVTCSDICFVNCMISSRSSLIVSIECINSYSNTKFTSELIKLQSFLQSFHHIQTSQLTCRAEQMTDFYMIATLALNELN